jgi:hypothetical protein
MIDSGVIKLAQALAEFMGANRDPGPPTVATSRYVTIDLAATKTGLTPKAIRRKIESGAWIELREYRRAPDGHIMIDMEGVQSWVEKAAASKSAKIASA